MAAQVAEPKRKPGRPKRTIATIPTDKQAHILEVSQAHTDLTLREVAAICDTSHSHVIATLQRYGIQRKAVEDFKKHRADILAGMQHRLLVSMTDEDIKRMPGGSRVLAAAQLFDKERLQNDLSSFNVASVHADVAAMMALDAKDKGD
jgi:predicted DNA-binding protein YlxM (UPF0122 family)